MRLAMLRKVICTQQVVWTIFLESDGKRRREDFHWLHIILLWSDKYMLRNDICSLCCFLRISRLKRTTLFKCNEAWQVTTQWCEHDCGYFFVVPRSNENVQWLDDEGKNSTFLASYYYIVKIQASQFCDCFFGHIYEGLT